MKHISFFLLVLPILCLMACSSNDDADELTETPAVKGKPVQIEVSETPLIDPEAGQANSGMFRAPIMTKSTLQQFYVNGYWNSGKYNEESTSTYDVSNGTWSTILTWPTNISQDDIVSFYAYANVHKDDTEFNYSETGASPYNPFLIFEVEEYADKQKDLLVAKKTAQLDSKVHFYFTHPCAALQFAICKTKALTNIDIDVTEVILHNIYKTGSYYFDTDTWGIDPDFDTKSHFTLYSSSKTGTGISVPIEESSTDQSKSFHLNVDDDYLFFIPQDIAPWNGGSISETSGAYIEIKCHFSKINGSVFDGSVYMPFSASLAKGYIHRFNIRMGSSLKDANGNTINFRN